MIRIKTWKTMSDVRIARGHGQKGLTIDHIPIEGGRCFRLVKVEYSD